MLILLAKSLPKKRTLYVCRSLKNAAAFTAWAHEQGFTKILEPDDLHVTIAFSRSPVNWTAAGDSFDSYRSTGGKRSVVALGDKGAVVLKFESTELTQRWQAFRDEGASWDFPSYQPHVTVTYDGKGVDLTKVKPFEGPLEFGPERFAPVDEDWSKKIKEKPLQKADYTHPEPTPAQIKAGNYAKRVVIWRGLQIAIENERGSTRRGTKPDGTPWATQMKHAYGYAKASTGADGDEVDIFLGPDLNAPTVYVVHQRKVDDWATYDEDKCMVGFATEEAARAAFLANYDDPRFLGPITAMPAETFVQKAKATKDKPSMIKALFWKGGPGSGNHGHKGRPGEVGGSAPAPSADIHDAASARAYWRTHFAGKTVRLNVRTKSGEHAVSVSFDDTDTHMWTREAAASERPDAFDRPSSQAGPRVYDGERAIYMDRLLPTIASPWRVLGHMGRQVYIGSKLPDGRVYTVVLSVTAPGQCAFVTAYPRNAQQLERTLREGRPEQPGLRKSEKAPGEGTPGALAGLQLTGPSGPTSGEVCCEPTEDGRRSNAGASMAQFFEFFKALGPGERWITIHPNGADAKGQPVLIQPQADGSAKIIGGAGGALNHLRLTEVKPESSYKETLAARSKERRERRAAQRKRDREAGLAEAKAQAHQRVTEQRQSADRAFVAGVAEAMGWKPEDVTFNPEVHAKDAAQADLAKLQAEHERDLLARAKAAVKLNRSRLLQDGDHRAAAEVGGVPLQTDDPETLAVQDIDPVSQPSGLGFAPDYGARAEQHGATPEAITEEAEALKTRRPRVEGLPGRIVEGAKLLRDPERDQNLKPKLLEAQQTLALLKLDKKRRMAEVAASAARKTINDAVEEPKAAVIDIDDAKVDQAVAEEVANDLRTIATRNFLNEVAATSSDPVRQLQRHVGAGAYNAVNALALAAGGAALVDRSVVDVLGVAGAAEVLARRLHADLSPEDMVDVLKGMEDFHLNHYQGATEAALKRAGELKTLAGDLELGEAEGADGLAELQEINRRRADAVAEAQKVLGQALGETEANAALVYALRRGRVDRPFQVALGDISPEGAIRQLRALGLQRGDYTLETAGGVRVAAITPDGMDRLAQPVNTADLEQVRRNLDIISGGQDEDGWLPEGLADRPDLGLDLKPGVAATLARPFDPRGELEDAVRAYIGGRAADGDAPADIVSDLQSADFFRQVGPERAGVYRDVLDRLAPLQDADGALRPAEALRADFESLADDYVRDMGGEIAPLHRQSFSPDETAVEAAHRALAAEPTGVAAYKPVGELTPQDQGALRDWFSAHVAREDAGAAQIRAELSGLTEPDRYAEDMFGDRSETEDWRAWRAKRAELTGKLDAASLNWPKYVSAMGSPQAAYAAVQDLVQSKVSDHFAQSYNTLKPDAPLKLGRGAVRGGLDHLDAVDPKAREARMARDKAMVDGLRERIAGRYASGGVRDKLDAARQEEAGLKAAQMGFFADAEDAPERPLGADERHTLGHAAERQLAKLVPAVGANFKAGRPVKLFKPTMSGGKAWARQRAVKLIGANKRVALSFGTGAGKTLIGLSSFADLHSQGKAKKGLFVVPSIAQGGFGADALRFLEPGKFKWHAQPGASREQRLAAYKDPDTHFAVVTHQAFRDDMLHLGAQQSGLSEGEMASRVGAMSRPERKAWAEGVMKAHGMSPDYLMVDEGHNLLDREGKADSSMANVLDGVSDATPYYVNATADPVKNDVSEAFSLLQKMDSGRYTDRSAFMRRYGVDTAAAKDGLRRELARFQYPSKIDPDVTANRGVTKLKPSPAQEEALTKLDRTFARARLARMQGQVDVSALQEIAPEAFADAPLERHEAIAKGLCKSLGLLKNAAIQRTLDAHPQSAKADAVVEMAKARKGKGGVVFAHGLETVATLKRRLEGEGFRVVSITGKDSAEDKAKAIRAFNPDAGERQADIVVCSDAGATGANLQSGEWLVNYDTPATAMTHAQREGRINRTGQTRDIELHDLVYDHPAEAKARERLKTKYALRELMTTPMETLDDTGVGYFLKQRRAQREAEEAR